MGRFAKARARSHNRQHKYDTKTKTTTHQTSATPDSIMEKVKYTLDKFPEEGLHAREGDVVRFQDGLIVHEHTKKDGEVQC